jgi:hypothetical protein
VLVAAIGSLVVLAVLLVVHLGRGQEWRGRAEERSER